MSTIRELLKDTMLAAAHLGVKREEPEWPNSWPPPPTVLPSMPFADSELANAIRRDNQHIWHFSEPVFTMDDKVPKVQIQDLTCLVSKMGMAMKVCQYIKWGPVSIHSREFSSDIDLPLTDDYLIEKWFSPYGKMDGTTRFWKQPETALTDKSFEWVFAYELPWLAPSNSTFSTPQPLLGHKPENLKDLRDLNESLQLTFWVRIPKVQLKLKGFGFSRLPARRQR